jgi:hypothetical protein
MLFLAFANTPQTIKLVQKPSGEKFREGICALCLCGLDGMCGMCGTDGKCVISGICNAFEVCAGI